MAIGSPPPLDAKTPLSPPQRRDSADVPSLAGDAEGQGQGQSDAVAAENLSGRATRTLFGGAARLTRQPSAELSTAENPRQQSNQDIVAYNPNNAATADVSRTTPENLFGRAARLPRQESEGPASLSPPQRQPQDSGPPRIPLFGRQRQGLTRQNGRMGGFGAAAIDPRAAAMSRASNQGVTGDILGGQRQQVSNDQQDTSVPSSVSTGFHDSARRQSLARLRDSFFSLPTRRDAIVPGNALPSGRELESLINDTLNSPRGRPVSSDAATHEQKQQVIELLGDLSDQLDDFGINEQEYNDLCTDLANPDSTLGDYKERLNATLEKASVPEGIEKREDALTALEKFKANIENLR